ncbi:MAG: hypothetical protein JOY55_15295 [Mycobacterium sp.]|nr:hypothetical protein [Mycobacterium sp.]
MRGPDVPTFLDRVAALPPRVRDGMSMVSIHQIRSATGMAKIDHTSALLMVHHVFLGTVTESGTSLVAAGRATLRSAMNSRPLA